MVATSDEFSGADGSVEHHWVFRKGKTMQQVTSEISMSLDGFITDPDASVGTPLEGNDPGRLHAWRFDDKTDVDAAIVEDLYAKKDSIETPPATHLRFDVSKTRDHAGRARGKES